jgi:hypothetical protein
MPEKKNLFGVVEYFPISVKDLESCIHASNFWGKFIPAREATADFTSDTVMHFVASDNVPVPVTVEGDLEFVEEEEGVLRFRLLRENFHQINSLFGRLRYREESSKKTKVGIFVEELNFSSGFLNLIGKTTAVVEAKTRLKKAFQKFAEMIARGEVPPAG